MVFGDFWSPSRPRRTLPQQLPATTTTTIPSFFSPLFLSGVEVYLENQEEEEEEGGRSLPFSVCTRVPRQAEEFDRFCSGKKSVFPRETICGE